MNEYIKDMKRVTLESQIAIFERELEAIDSCNVDENGDYSSCRYRFVEGELNHARSELNELSD